MLSGDRVLAERFEPMKKGQAEHLMPMIEEVMAEAGFPLHELDAIAVGVGPGNFTGIRIGVSAARGLALALGKPAIGITSFEVMRDADGHRSRGRQLVALPGPRDSYLMQTFEAGIAQGAPHAVPTLTDASWRDIGVTGDTEILGHDAEQIARAHSASRGGTAQPSIPRALPQKGFAAVLGHIARRKLSEPDEIPRPTPVYVRPADAAPSRETGPTILPC